MALPTIACRYLFRHSEHEWTHYNIDTNVQEQAWCPGDYLVRSNEDDPISGYNGYDSLDL